ncbi:hypothetical protein BH10BDE1_BH10BDE1_20880 [soil metagenome]
MTLSARFFVSLAALVFAVASASAHGYSRGPYLPQNADLVLPGTLMARDGLNERCEDRRFPCDGRSELVLVQNGASYEFGNVGYNCVEIDDGAYGALKCAQVGFTRLGVYADCVQPTAPPLLTAELEFRGFYCSK